MRGALINQYLDHIEVIKRLPTEIQSTAEQIYQCSSEIRTVMGGMAMNALMAALVMIAASLLIMTHALHEKEWWRIAAPIVIGITTFWVMMKYFVSDYTSRGRRLAIMIREYIILIQRPEGPRALEALRAIGIAPFDPSKES